MERVQPLLLSLDDGTLALIANQVGRRATRLRELCKALHSRLRRHLVCLRGNHGHSTFEFHFHVTKAALSRGAPLMSSFVSSDDLTPTIRVNETYWETWAFVLLVYQLEDPTSWPAFHPAAWPALPLIHKWDATPLLPLVRQHIHDHPTARAIRSLEEFYGDEIDWSHAELRVLIEDLVYDHGGIGFLKGFKPNMSAPVPTRVRKGLTQDYSRVRDDRDAIHSLRPCTLVRLLDFAVNEMEWEPPILQKWHLRMLWRHVRDAAYELYEYGCHQMRDRAGEYYRMLGLDVPFDIHTYMGMDRRY